MKKIRLFVIVLALMFSLTFFTACGEKEDKEPEVKEYSVTLTLEDGTVFNTVKALEGEAVQLGTPSKDGYTFAGWYNGEVLVDGSQGFDADVTLVAKFTINQYTYQFVVDGEVVKEETADYGATIEYPSNPSKAATAEFTFEFKGWDKDVTTLTDNVVFTAQFDSTVNQYTYKFVDYDGEVLKEELVDYGTMPVAPADPTREASDKYEYTFIGWDKEITKVEGEVVYTAQYEEKKIELPITSLEGLKVSLLGDSITTFYDPASDVNSYYGGENQFYYPKYGGIKAVENTWWYSFILNNKMELGINNSWSGSCAYGTSTSAGVHDGRINTIVENGEPDIVIIYLGTNDCATGYTVEQFGGAINTMIEKVNALTDADIFLMTLGYSEYKGMSYTEANRLAYNEKLRAIAAEQNCGIIPLDEYVVEDNCSIYLADNLHYNTKGAALLSKITEKAVKEYYDIEFEGEIEVEHKEPLPEGAVGKVTVTTNGKGVNFWVDAANYIFLVDSSYTFAQWSFRIQFSKGENGNYYVTAINPSGDSSKYDADYILIVSEAHADYKSITSDLKNVEVGCVVEFDETAAFPLDILFKVNDGGSAGGNEPEVDDPVVEEPLPEGAKAAFTATSDTNFWGNYANNIFLVELPSSFAFAKFSYRISLTKGDDDKYYVSALEETGSDAAYAGDYVIIFSEAVADASTYIEAFKKLSIGDVAEFDPSAELPVKIVFKAAE